MKDPEVYIDELSDLSKEDMEALVRNFQKLPRVSYPTSMLLSEDTYREIMRREGFSDEEIDARLAEMEPIEWETIQK